MQLLNVNIVYYFLGAVTPVKNQVIRNFQLQTACMYYSRNHRSVDIHFTEQLLPMQPGSL